MRTTNKEREKVRSIKLSEQDFPVICTLTLRRPECFCLLTSSAVENIMSCRKFETFFLKLQSIFVFIPDLAGKTGIPAGESRRKTLQRRIQRHPLGELAPVLLLRRRAKFLSNDFTNSREFHLTPPLTAGFHS